MKKIILFLFLSSSLNLHSQNPGYAGKHFILKTNAINGKFLGFTNADIEYVAARNITVTAYFNYFQYKSAKGTVRNKTGTINPGGDPNVKVFDEITEVYPGTTKGWDAGIGIKYYFNKIIPAPVGLYTGFDFGYGNAGLSFSYKVTYENVDMFEPYTYNPVGSGVVYSTSKTCSFYHLSFPSVGYQAIYFGFLALDAKFSFDGYFNNLPKKYTDTYPYDYVTPNLAAIHLNSISLSEKQKNYKISYGPSIYLKIGFLLF